MWLLGGQDQGKHHHTAITLSGLAIVEAGESQEIQAWVFKASAWKLLHALLSFKAHWWELVTWSHFTVRRMGNIEKQMGSGEHDWVCYNNITPF